MLTRLRERRIWEMIAWAIGQSQKECWRLEEWGEVEQGHVHGVMWAPGMALMASLQRGSLREFVQGKCHA
jgi:hypothetical protein